MTRHHGRRPTARERKRERVRAMQRRRGLRAFVFLALDDGGSHGGSALGRTLSDALAEMRRHHAWIDSAPTLWYSTDGGVAWVNVRHAPVEVEP